MTVTAPLTNTQPQPLHFVVEKASLIKALGHCQGIVERRNTVPILSHVLIEAQTNVFRLTATDLEMAFIETGSAHVHIPGRATVAAHLLFDVVRKLPEGAEIELKTSEDGSSLLLKSGRSTYNFACLAVEEFPETKVFNMAVTFQLHAAELGRLIDKTRFAMATEETRYYLNGICLHTTQDGNLRAVATDGLRLAQAQMEKAEDIPAVPEMIISRKTIYEIRKLIEDVAENVTISCSDKQVRFEVGPSVLVSRLIEGRFPDYEKVIPFGNENVLEVDVKAFADAVDRISIMSTDKLRPVKLRVEGQKMMISAHSTETGNAVEELDVSYSGQPLDFGFNARFILDVTQQMTGSKLQFLVGDDTQAIIAKDAEDASALYVLMPMRV